MYVFGHTLGKGTVAFLYTIEERSAKIVLYILTVLNGLRRALWDYGAAIPALAWLAALADRRSDALLGLLALGWLAIGLVLALFDHRADAGDRPVSRC